MPGVCRIRIGPCRACNHCAIGFRQADADPIPLLRQQSFITARTIGRSTENETGSRVCLECNQAFIDQIGSLPAIQLLCLT
ncbi:hypothetical protein D3C73_968000 [compost metagenome]